MDFYTLREFVRTPTARPHVSNQVGPRKCSLSGVLLGAPVLGPLRLHYAKPFFVFCFFISPSETYLASIYKRLLFKYNETTGIEREKERPTMKDV